jgi:hypothetical protein
MSPHEQRDAVMRELDRLLGVQTITKAEKARLIREIADSAARMADGIERRLRETV